MDKKEAYRALSDIVFKGFLTAQMKVGSSLFIFKTINDKELSLIKMYSGSPDDYDFRERFDLYYIVFSLLFINGVNVLVDRHKNIPELFSQVATLPESFFKLITTKLSELRSYSYESVKYLEGFTYTSLSRSQWRVLNGVFPNRDEYTGVHGTKTMGLNYHQESWVSINRSLDDEINYNSNFSMALFVASASNPKGVRNARGQFDTTKKSSEDRREKLARLGSLDVSEWKPQGWAAPVDTVEELLAELDRQMDGKKDKHDNFIEDYMASMKSRAENQAEKAKDRIREARAKVGIDDDTQSFIEGGESYALSQEETEKLMLRKKSNLSKPKDMENEVSQNDKEKFISKIGSRVLTSKG